MDIETEKRFILIIRTMMLPNFDAAEIIYRSLTKNERAEFTKLIDNLNMLLPL
jgi:hypothetical protein